MAGSDWSRGGWEGGRRRGGKGGGVGGKGGGAVGEKEESGEGSENSELYYTRIKILGSCLFL